MICGCHHRHRYQLISSKKQAAWFQFPCSLFPTGISYRLAKLKGLAVGTFLLRRVHLMRTYLNALQCAVLRICTMVRTLIYRTADALVCMTLIHNRVLLLFDSTIACPSVCFFIHFLLQHPQLPVPLARHTPFAPSPEIPPSGSHE